MGDKADFCQLYVRTDDEGAKQGGITCLLVDMRTSGIEARPIVTMAGGTDFSELFFTDVRVPVSAVLGEIDGGWGPAKTVMSSESTLIGSGGMKAADAMMALVKLMGRNTEPEMRQKVADTYAREKILAWMAEAVLDAARRGEPLPLDPSLLKLHVAESRRRDATLAPQLLGMAATAVAHEASEWSMERLHFRFGVSIGGGTDEVHKNNVAERALGLPRDPRADKDVAWRDTLRSHS